MSEQVGASLVMAQIINPAAGTTPGATSPLAGTEQLQGSLASGSATTQPSEITEENSATFASLLSQLATLEVQDASGTLPLADTLIRIRVETHPPADQASAATDGNGPPVNGNDAADGGMILPVPPDLQMLQMTPAVEAATHTAAAPPGTEETEALDAPVVVREPRQAPTLAQSQAETPAATEPTRAVMPPLTSADRSVPEPAADSRLPGQPANPAVSAVAIDPDAAANSSDEHASEQGSRQSEQQAATTRGEHALPARAAGSGASISFSQDPTNTAAPTAGIISTPAPAAPGVLPQTLPLLGQPSTWAEPLAERLAGIAARGMNTAEVRLHPPSLGQLEVRITINNDQASIWVTSANADVREALQQALPRLDSLLNSLGIELADAEVSDQQPREFNEDHGPDESAAETPGTGENLAGPATDSNRLGILDTWA